ncbi:MAG: ERAP1-like C-terminal domain-containing protein [Haliscomenobacter sp.]|nr:ERAP1-like C-terminal domain-containing protein [Haliscomenobacter sp.]
MKWLLFVFFLMSMSILFGQKTRKGVPLEPGVSLALAEERAARMSGLEYDLFFNLPDSAHLPIPAEVTLRFNLISAKAPLQLDFRVEPDRLKSVRVQGKSVPAECKEGHILIPAKYLRKGHNEIAVEFTAGDLSLNRNEDYLYTLLVPDRASTVFPCFDQPDLKARYRLELEMPAAWEASANGALEEERAVNGRKRLRFRETQPFSTYVFAFAAGQFQKRTQSRAGRAMTMLYRETDDAKVARNADTIFDLHAQAIEWLEAYTQIPFPFDKLDFVLLPGFQYGGMEHIGNIFYREGSLILDETATENQKLGRARLIAHETAHMWFGDMVTMKWFNDVWLKEVFANFFAAKAVNPSFPKINHDLSFLLAHQPTAYSEDRSGGSHPIQQPLENLREAGSLYGGIIYQKAPVVMRQLEALMGEEAFRKGIQEYLKTFAYSNATWDDLVGILDAYSEEDLQGWSRVWVKEPGMPAIRTEWHAGSNGRLEKLTLVQEKKAPSGANWIQSTVVALAYPDTVVRIPVRLEADVTEVVAAKGLPCPLAVLSNASSMGYGYFRLDSISLAYGLRQFASIGDPLLRGAAWLALYEELVRGRVAPDAFLQSILGALPRETEPLNRQNLLGYLGTVCWHYLAPAQRAKIAPEVESLLWDLLANAQDMSGKAAFFSTLSNLSITAESVSRLKAVWDGSVPVPGLPLSEAQQVSLASELALRLPDEADAILSRQLERTQNPDRRKRLEFIRPALSPDPAVRDAFFESLKNPANRATEPWVVDGAGYLNHPLRAEAALKYIRPSLELLEEIQRTGDIFFPRQFITAVLSGHQSEEAAEIVRNFLRDHPEFPYRLRNKVLMAADLLLKE